MHASQTFPQLTLNSQRCLRRPVLVGCRVVTSVLSVDVLDDESVYSSIRDDVILVVLLDHTIALRPLDGGSIQRQLALKRDRVSHGVGLAVLELADEGNVLFCDQRNRVGSCWTRLYYINIDQFCVKLEYVSETKNRRN